MVYQRYQLRYKWIAKNDEYCNAASGEGRVGKRYKGIRNANNGF